MDTNALKSFAQQARRKLLEQVTSKMEFVLNTDSPALREKAEQVNKLREAIKETSKDLVIDKVTYTWFNRFIALRFMDANDYQPIGIRVLTPKDGFTLPELLDEAKQGHIPEELSVKKQRIYDLLDGKIPSSNGQNEAYKELLIATCNHLNKVFPFLFEQIDDYTELLLPNDLTSELSIVQVFRDGMKFKECKEVEIVGWLYQFYISEKNEELIGSKKRYATDELAPASQLFTPKWIVKYMVDNTLGQLWSEINPASKVPASLNFYIKPSFTDQLQIRDKKSVEEIKFFEPCVGSGHILSYAYDVFYKIYEEEGYNPSEIPELIITKNLWGVDIDPRAAQLASFVLMMKGREKQTRFFKKKIQANIYFYEDFPNDDKFKNATSLGSLIKVEQSDIDRIKVDENSLFAATQIHLKNLYRLLGQVYDVVVTNPPYISSSRMEEGLQQYLELNYPEAKSDLFSGFMLRNLELVNYNGLTGYMSPFVWMFISSYEELRKTIIDKHSINNLIQLEYAGFDGATVPICTFTLRNNQVKDGKGSYIRLSNFKGAKVQEPQTLLAIKNPSCGWFYVKPQLEFKKVPGTGLAYWLTDKELNIYEKKQILSAFTHPAKGIDTGENEYFLRFWSEIQFENLDISKGKGNWVPYNKGGEFRRWYGNREYVLRWNQGFDLAKRSSWKKKKPTLRNKQKWFREGFAWTTISSGGFSARYCEAGAMFDNGGCTLFANENLILFGAFLNSKVASRYLEFLSPTLNFQPGGTGALPICDNFFNSKINIDLGVKSISISKEDWNCRETSWDFKQSELLKHQAQDLEETYDLYQQYWKNKFFQLHKFEVELNSQFIQIYGLMDEITPNIPLKEITILKEETSIEKDQLLFHADEVFTQFISYAVGCIFGRYSLDKQGLILANQGESLENYLANVGLEESELSFVPDIDNIIPVLDDEWFEDDIVCRFYAFVKASFGTTNFDKNIAFVEDCLGKDIRKYFIKDFYADHIKRYKKRPIYWLFSSPKGSFNVLIYMHRYTPDTLNTILNHYLIEYREKLSVRIEHMDHSIVSGTSAEQTRATKEKDRIKLILLELQEYEREILRPLAIERIKLDLDEGVLVNYNKFGKAIKEVAGLNDKVTKKKVREFDWINIEDIR